MFLTLDEFLWVSLESFVVGSDRGKRVGPSGTTQAYLIGKISYFLLLRISCIHITRFDKNLHLFPL